MLPLEGITVLDLSRLLPAPLATLFMAQMGARVIKIEDPSGGDYIRWTPPLTGKYSSFFYILNRGKESLTLNLKKEEGREIFKKLVEKADVLVESFRPGVMDSLDLGYETLSEINPSLIYAAVTGYGYGETPYLKRAGHDLNYVSINGIASLNGTRETGPLHLGIQVADIGGGAYMTLISVLAALIERSTTGRGKFLDISMTHGSIPFTVMGFAEFIASGKSPGPEGYTLNGLYPCYRIYRAKDGYVSLAALEPKFWQNFCRAVGREDLLDKAFATGKEGEKVREELEKIFKSKTVEEWEKLNEEYDFCCEAVNDFENLLKSPLIRENEVIGKDENGRGFLKFPVRNLRKDEIGEAPDIGRDTEKILKELGLDELESLKKKGVI